MSDDLQRFIDQSDRPLIYISLGTYFAFSEEHSELVMKTLAQQSTFNVIWSNKRWTPELDGKLDKQKFFMRPKLAQRNILECGKV